MDPTLQEQGGWQGYFSQDFYHGAIVPLLLITAAVSYAARPSVREVIPPGFRKLQQDYLPVWAFCVAADWLQGPYVYALYKRYGFSQQEIAQLFVMGFGSSLVFGSFVGTFADKFGRKKCCVCYCILYILSCLTKHFRDYNMLMIGRITGGIATSMLFSCFECWMVSEHLQRYNFSGSLLGYMFGLMFTLMYSVAIFSGLVGQFVASTFEWRPFRGHPDSIIWAGAESAPFDVAIVCLITGLAFIIPNWTENFGGQQRGNGSEGAAGLMDNIRAGVGLLRADRRALLLGICVSSFEGSMYAFVFNWTPALDSRIVPPPHGVIFALFMMACMCGASTATLVGDAVKPSVRLMGVFVTSCLSFGIASFALSAGVEDNLKLSLFAFLLFEFSVGVYFPTIGVLKSEIVPEEVRGTVYNLYRVPLNLIVVGLLLGNMSISACFKLNAALQAVALVCMSLIVMSPGKGTAHVGKGSSDEEAPTKDYAMVVQEDSSTSTTVVGKRRDSGA